MGTRTASPTVEELLGRARELGMSFAERAAEHDREASFPFENFDALRDAGLLALAVPERFGGAGAGLEDACRATEAIARGEPSTALVYAMTNIYQGMGARSPQWSQPIYEEMARAAVERGATINVMRVEPDLGSPSRGGLPVTTATPSGDGFRLSGHKLYSTGCPILAYYLVWGRTAGEDPKVGYFVVPREAPGIRIVETWDQMGMRATASHDVIFEDVAIPAANALDVRAPSEWGFLDPVQMSWNNLVISSLYHGVACAARDWLVGYLHERVPSNLGAALSTLPRFQMAVGEMEALLMTSERLLYGLAREIDAGSKEATGQTSTAKYVANSNSIRAVEIAISLTGNPGLSRHNPLERHYRDVLCSRIHIPQDDQALTGAGRSALGI
jgi:alkylation response protein AidB-like acyl-CoA dehydrogenase